MESVTIDGKVYVKKSEIDVLDGMKYCIIRCRDAGVHAGYLLEWDKKFPRVVKLVQTRRLWRWWGKTLSGLAKDGTFAPEKCKFSDEIQEITLLDASEIIPCTIQSRKSIQGVKQWEND